MATMAPRSISKQKCIMYICMYHKQIYAYYIYFNGQLSVADYEEFETNYINMFSLDNQSLYLVVIICKMRGIESFL